MVNSTFDNMFCSSIVDLFLGHVWLEHFVKHVHFSLEEIIIEIAIKMVSYFISLYRNRSALVIGKFDDKLGSGSFLGVIERPEAAHHPNIVFLGQLFVVTSSIAPWVSRIGHFLYNFTQFSFKRGSRFRGFYKGSFLCSPPY